MAEQTVHVINDIIIDDQPVFLSDYERRVRSAKFRIFQ